MGRKLILDGEPIAFAGNGKPNKVVKIVDPIGNKLMMSIRNPKIPIEVYENPLKIDLEAALYFGESAPDFVFEN